MPKLLLYSGPGVFADPELELPYLVPGFRADTGFARDGSDVLVTIDLTPKSFSGYTPPSTLRVMAFSESLPSDLVLDQVLSLNPVADVTFSEITPDKIPIRVTGLDPEVSYDFVIWAEYSD
jgi:hypothetical protein